VAIAVMVLRRAEPARERPFKTPLAWIIAPLAIIGCVYLFSSLNSGTILRFFIWMAIGIPVYLLWGAHQSALAKKS
jgi:APA family basic amino acid/polyamine antiporter